MNLRDPKNQIFVVVLVLIGAAVYLWYTSIYTSFNEKIGTLAQEQSALAAKLNSVKQKAATIDQLEAEYKELQLKYKSVEMLLPERKEDEAFLAQVHMAAQMTDSMVKKITPLGMQPSDFYETNSYMVEVESSYHNLGRFLATVANFPFIVNINALQLKTSKEGSGQALLDPTNVMDSRETIIATFKLSTYNVKQGAVG